MGETLLLTTVIALALVYWFWRGPGRMDRVRTDKTQQVVASCLIAATRAEGADRDRIMAEIAAALDEAARSAGERRARLRDALVMVRAATDRRTHKAARAVAAALEEAP